MFKTKYKHSLKERTFYQLELADLVENKLKFQSRFAENVSNYENIHPRSTGKEILDQNVNFKDFFKKI